MCLCVGSVSGDKEHTFSGDRTKEDIVKFALRMSGPAVQQISRPESLEHLKSHTALFFMYVGAQDGALWTLYSRIAVHFQPHGFFYAAREDLARRHVGIDDLPAVFVYKESMHYFYPGNGIQLYTMDLVNE